jgi:hypothetical protein
MKITSVRVIKMLGFAALALIGVFILATPGFSPIHAHRNRVKVAHLCSSVQKGDSFDLAAFKTRAAADGLYASEWPEGNTVSVMERYLLMANVICYVELDKGLVASSRTIVHWP